MVTYYLSEDSLSVHMTAPRNSGLPSGDLLKRQKLWNLEKGRVYQPHDLTIGAVLKVCA